MPTGICQKCNRETNSTTSNWGDKKPEGYGVVTECYVAWVDDKPVNGCAFNSCDNSYIIISACKILGKKIQVKKMKINGRIEKVHIIEE